jgi:hypothetical protein
VIVTLCGSNRFEDHFKTWNRALTLTGHTVFSLTAYASDHGKKEWFSPEEKQALDEAHRRKIATSRAVLVLNVFGYMGESTLAEIEYARAINKEIYVLESWGKGNGIGQMHYDSVRVACRVLVPEYKGSPIDTTRFRYAFDLLHENLDVHPDMRRTAIALAQACDKRVKCSPD